MMSGRVRKLRNVTSLINLLGRGFNYSVTSDGKLLLNSTCRTFAMVNRQRRPVKLFGREFLTALGTLTHSLVWGSNSPSGFKLGGSQNLPLFVTLERLNIAYRELLGFGSLRFVFNSQYVLQDLDLLLCVLRKLIMFDCWECHERTRSVFVELLNSRNTNSMGFFRTPVLTIPQSGPNDRIGDLPTKAQKVWYDTVPAKKSGAW